MTLCKPLLLTRYHRCTTNKYRRERLNKNAHSFGKHLPQLHILVHIWKASATTLHFLVYMSETIEGLGQGSQS